MKYEKPKLILLNSENEQIANGLCQNGSADLGVCTNGGTAGGGSWCRSGGTPFHHCGNGASANKQCSQGSTPWQ